MWRGKRYRMAANEFAIPRMEPGKQRPIQSMEEARDWERLFIGEIKAGRDPNRIPVRFVQAGAQLGDVAAVLDAYWERCVKPAGLKSLGSVRSQVSVLKQHLGHLALSALEEPDEINRFKTESDWAEDVELASVQRALERLRAAINWGLAQTPPLFARSPFHRFGVRLNNVGEMLHDRIIGALELCCRRGEMLVIQNKRVNWDTCQIGIPARRRRTKRTVGKIRVDRCGWHRATETVMFVRQIVPILSRSDRKSGSSGWTRTSNPPVNSRMLCH
jgi:hypothetical protein